MIGTTHFTNAVVERRHLTPTACIRLGLPGDGLPAAHGRLAPMTCGRSSAAMPIWRMAGTNLTGAKSPSFSPDEVRDIAEKIRDAGLDAIAISSVFSPVNAAFE